jgi:hypothetical protein
MVARGVAEITSNILSEDKEDDASLWQEKAAGGEVFHGGSSEMTKLTWRH